MNRRQRKKHLKLMKQRFIKKISECGSIGHAVAEYIHAKLREPSILESLCDGYNQPQKPHTLENSIQVIITPWDLYDVEENIDE